MELLIDADIVAYRAAASAENEEEGIALARMHDIMHGILSSLQHTGYRCYLSGGGNFRKVLYPEYKANRVQPKPKWLHKCREHLVISYNAVIVDGIEADDAIGMNMGPETVCVSIDKDLRQLPGWHYNFVKGQLDEVNEYDAEYNFYAQFLIGDRSDNIFGVQGIGEKKAEKILYGMDVGDMFSKVRELYNNDARFLLNGQLLHVFRKKDDIWLPQSLEYLWFGTDPSKVVEAAKYEYWQQILEESTQSPVPMKQQTETGFPVDGQCMEGLLESTSPLPTSSAA